jgi:soluble lytic murein transglycosylase-like protein
MAMKRLLVAIFAVLAAFPAARAQSPPKVLSTRDAALYAAAFASVRQGDFDALDRARRHVKDNCLIGRLTYLKLMHPTYHAQFDELKAWLVKYKDQPDAENIFALAKKRRPGGALQPLAQGGATPTGLALMPTDDGLTKPTPPLDPKIQAAREAYYNAGDLATAYTLATASGERWVAGMAAYRLGRYSEALGCFSALSLDMTKSEWVRSAAEFWAARSAVAAGEPEKAPDYLRRAAKTPYTFYGLIAERQLGLEPAVKADGYDMGGDDDADEPAGGIVLTRVKLVEPMNEKALLKLAKSDKRARRAVALAQIDQRADEMEEMRLALANSGSDEARRTWRSLAFTLGAPVVGAGAVPARHRFDISDFQTPSLTPTGGYTLDKALVYAIIRQESHFNPDAASAAGAYGLMQMTPATAATNTGIDPATITAAGLLDPSANMRLGQDYMKNLLLMNEGDILRAVAAYNAGPKGVGKLAAAMPDADSLLLIESLAGAETREFVQRVMSNYWIYRQIFNQPSPTLDAAAAGSKKLLAAWDQTASDMAQNGPARAPPQSAPLPAQPQ